MNPGLNVLFPVWRIFNGTITSVADGQALGTMPTKKAGMPAAAKDHIIAGGFMPVSHNRERTKKTHRPKHIQRWIDTREVI